MFEGIRGPSFEGDIAIDDVSITIGKCKPENTVASAGKTGKIFCWMERQTVNTQRNMKNASLSAYAETFKVAEMTMILRDLKCVLRL